MEPSFWKLRNSIKKKLLDLKLKNEVSALHTSSSETSVDSGTNDILKNLRLEKIWNP